MTNAGQAFLFACAVFSLCVAGIALVYFADRLRSDVLEALNAASKRRARRWPGGHATK